MAYSRLKQNSNWWQSLNAEMKLQIHFKSPLMLLQAESSRKSRHPHPRMRFVDGNSFCALPRDRERERHGYLLRGSSCPFPPLNSSEKEREESDFHQHGIVSRPTSCEEERTRPDVTCRLRPYSKHELRCTNKHTQAHWCMSHGCKFNSGCKFKILRVKKVPNDWLLLWNAWM